MKRDKQGFTILEMLVVVAVMAIIATLATGAALKAIQNTRQKRIVATRRVLEAALNNYRAQQNKWPFNLSELTRVPNNRTLYRATGEDNAVVFDALLRQNISLLGDTSALLTRVRGRRMSVKQALEEKLSPIPIGYPNPTNTDEFRFYSVEYNSVTDSIRVY